MTKEGRVKGNQKWWGSWRVETPNLRRSGQVAVPGSQRSWSPKRGTAPQNSSHHREVALPRAATKKAERNSPTSLSYHPPFLFWYLLMAKPRQQPEASAAPRGPLLRHRAGQRRQRAFAWQEGEEGRWSEIRGTRTSQLAPQAAWPSPAPPPTPTSSGLQAVGGERS